MQQAGSVDFSGDVRLATSRGARFALLAAGHTCVALGVIGAFLPVMPTTVFLIVAAGCYARGSTRFYNRLMNNGTFGPILRDWRQHRAMSVRTKAIALTMIVLAFGFTLVFAMTETWVRAVHVLTALFLIGFILRIRTRTV